jgi:hypothetical protein
VSLEWPVIPTDLASFYILIDSELMKVTATGAMVDSVRAFTVERAQFGTLAAAHNKNRSIALRQVTIGALSAGTVSIADAGGYFAGSTVEAALQEIGAIIAKEILTRT